MFGQRTRSVGREIDVFVYILLSLTIKVGGCKNRKKFINGEVLFKKEKNKQVSYENISFVMFSVI